MHQPTEHPPLSESLDARSGGTLEVVRFQPEQPDESQLPVYFAGGVGYGSGSETTESVLRAITDRGREAWTVERTAPGDIDGRFAITKGRETTIGSRGDAWRALADLAVSQVVALHQEAAAEDLLAAMDKAGIVRTDAILQSADALNGLIAASQHPERFNNIIFAYPGGQVRRPRPIRNMKATLREALEDKLSGSSQKETIPIAPQAHGETAGSKRSRLARYAGQSAMGLAATHSYQGNMLTTLRQGEQRPGVAMVVGLRDWMIRYDDVFNSLNSADNVDYIMVVDSGHGIKGRQDILDNILNLLPMLEARKQAGDDAAQPLRDRLILPEHISQKRADELRALADKVAA